MTNQGLYILSDTIGSSNNDLINRPKGPSRLSFKIIRDPHQGMRLSEDPNKIIQDNIRV